MSAGETKQSDSTRAGNGHGADGAEGAKNGNGQGDKHGGQENQIPKDLCKPRTITVVLVALVFLGSMVGLFILGWVPHHQAAEQAVADAKELSSGAPAVTVTKPHSESASKDINLPCDIKANQQAALYARTTGYIKQWTVDIGGHVKAGDLLAVIAAPDVDAQLNQTKAALEQAKATVIKSQADMEVALTDYQRYLAARSQNAGSVTDQDVDAKRGVYSDSVGALKVAEASVQQEEAAVAQLAVLQGFERVTAPFSGTITARHYDVGALSTASNTAAGTELFDIADTDTLRVFVNVPQTYATSIRIGQPAFLTVRNYAGREFKGTVARMSGALDPTTRTLPFELDFRNSDGSLYAGMYGQARLPVAEAVAVLTIPTSALVFNAKGLQAAVIRGGKVHFVPLTVGRDLGAQIEVTEGLASDDEVVTNPGERLVEGGEVQVTVGGK